MPLYIEIPITSQDILSNNLQAVKTMLFLMSINKYL